MTSSVQQLTDVRRGTANGHGGRWLLIVGLAVISMIFGFGAPASAYTQATAGSPGGVYGYQVVGSHYLACGSGCPLPMVKVPGPVVYRSPASTGTQQIGVLYTLQRWNGSSWVWQANQDQYATLYAGYSNIRMNEVTMLPNMGGYFRINILVAWSDSTNSRTFGSRFLDYSQSGDYTCNTTLRWGCSAGAGWVQVVA